MSPLLAINQSEALIIVIADNTRIIGSAINHCLQQFIKIIICKNIDNCERIKENLKSGKHRMIADHHCLESSVLNVSL